MRQAKLGKLSVSAIGLGCMSMSQSYGDADPDESERTLHYALDHGITFLDTANAYGRGHNESLIGKTLKSRRNDFVLASKFGIVRNKDGSRSIDGHPAQVATRCEESLKRLNTDVIDLYYLHRRDPKVPIEDTVGAMADLVAAGKVRYLGLSEVSATTLRRAHQTHPITAVQSEYSLWTRDPVSKVLPACRELGVGFVPFSPLGRAMLTGKITPSDPLLESDLRFNMPRFVGDNFLQNYQLITQFIAFAESLECTPAQLALAWLTQQGDDIVPIPGTKRVKFLDEDIKCTDVSLSPEALSFLEDLFAPENIHGQRYPAALMESIDTD